ncbi:MAG: small multi-drug export protein [Candidatus Methanomethylicia archaeon]|nr:small multi-drug export protein [Candidatus Methanomethylicia archaeon]
MNIYVNIMVLALLPVAESRLSIPYGIMNGVDLFTVVLLSIIGNIIPAPLILLTMNRIEKWIMSFNNENMVKKLFIKYIDNLRKRSKKLIEKYGFLGLIIFIAIPLPATGVWTGSIVAYIFGIDPKRAFFAIFIGLIIAIFIITIMTLGILSYD